MEWSGPDGEGKAEGLKTVSGKIISRHPSLAGQMTRDPTTDSKYCNFPPKLFSPFLQTSLQNNTAIMTEAQEIPVRVATKPLPHLGVSSVSTSPSATFHSPSSFGGALTRTGTGPTTRELKPFDTTDIKILLLENVNQSGQDILSKQGYQVESLKSSLPEDQLIEKIR